MAGIPLHMPRPGQWFEGSQQNAGPDTLRFARDVQQVGGSIAQVNISMTVFEEQGTVAPRHAAKRMARRLVLQIGFGLHYSAGGDAAAEFAHQNFAEQSAGESHGVRRQARARDAFDGYLKFARSFADDGSLRDG